MYGRMAWRPGFILVSLRPLKVVGTGSRSLTRNAVVTASLEPLKKWYTMGHTLNTALLFPIGFDAQDLWNRLTGDREAERFVSDP